MDERPDGWMSAWMWSERYFARLCHYLTTQTHKLSKRTWTLHLSTRFRSVLASFRVGLQNSACVCVTSQSRVPAMWLLKSSRFRLVWVRCRILEHSDMSHQKGDGSRSRGQKHQNTTAFKNDKYGATPQVKVSCSRWWWWGWSRI